MGGGRQIELDGLTISDSARPKKGTGLFIRVASRESCRCLLFSAAAYAELDANVQSPIFTQLKVLWVLCLTKSI